MFPSSHSTWQGEAALASENVRTDFRERFQNRFWVALPTRGQICWIDHGQSVGVFGGSRVQAFSSWPHRTQMCAVCKQTRFESHSGSCGGCSDPRSSSRRPEVACSVPARHGSFVQLLAFVFRAPRFSKDANSPETHGQAWTSAPSWTSSWMRSIVLSYFETCCKLRGRGERLEDEYQRFNPPSGRAPCPTSCWALKCLFWQNCRMFTRNVSSATGQSFTSIS